MEAEQHDRNTCPYCAFNNRGLEDVLMKMEEAKPGYEPEVREHRWGIDADTGQDYCIECRVWKHAADRWPTCPAVPRVVNPKDAKDQKSRIEALVESADKALDEKDRLIADQHEALRWAMIKLARAEAKLMDVLGPAEATKWWRLTGGARNSEDSLPHG